MPSALAALIAREDLDVAPDRALGHYTHEKNPVLARAALTTLAIIEDERLVENAARVGAYALARLEALKAEQPPRIVGEAMAEQFNRRTGVPFIGLRISNIMEPPDYARFATWQDDPIARKWSLWGYVEGRGVARAVRRSLEADVTGAEVAIVAAADTCMRRDSADLLAEAYPGVPLTRPVEGRETLLSIDHARDVLRYEPEHSWLDKGS